MYSFESAPWGLVALLLTGYETESGKAGRIKMYRCIYGIFLGEVRTICNKVCDS